LRCAVAYRVTNQWAGGFSGDVTISATAGTADGWTLTFTFPNGQQISNAWNATVKQSGNQITATDVGWNRHLGTADWGFNATWNGANTNPTSFSLNGTLCST